MLPRKLKFQNVFIDGVGYPAENTSVKLPNLKKKTEAFRGGGMPGEVKVANGHEGIDLESKFGGYMAEIVKQLGITRVDGLGLRYVGSYQRPDGAGVDAVEIVVRGFHEEIDRGDNKVGDDTEFTVKTSCSYYKESCNGAVLFEIDFLNMVWIVDGVDLLAAHRDAIGV